MPQPVAPLTPLRLMPNIGPVKAPPGNLEQTTLRTVNKTVGNENNMKTITTWILWGLSIASTLALSMVAFFERYGVEKYNAHLFRADFPTHNIFFHYTIPLFVIVYLLNIAFLIPRFRNIRPDLLAINTAIIFICLLSIVFSYFLTMTQLLPGAP